LFIILVLLGRSADCADCRSPVKATGHRSAAACRG
jgi:hypothetical protein